MWSLAKVIERLSVMFTTNGKREFGPRDQVSFSLVVYCSLFLRNVYVIFYPRELFCAVFICSFSILRNSHLESDVSAVCRIREA